VPANSELWVAFDASGAKPARGGVRLHAARALDAELGGHLYSAGVLPRYRGHGLQKRLIRKRIAAARARGWTCLVTETIYDNCRVGEFVDRVRLPAVQARKGVVERTATPSTGGESCERHPRL
jgi:GNAT superfamily N-acetyltransferase